MVVIYAADTALHVKKLKQNVKVRYRPETTKASHLQTKKLLFYW